MSDTCVWLDSYYVERTGVKKLLSTQNCSKHRDRKPGQVPR